MGKNKFFILVLIFCVKISMAQYVSGYRSPVDFPMILAGNVGEIRANHFHTGIDVKASKGVGTPVFAVADGYVSRIGVAPNGYGNFILVTHKDGMTSLYAHLNDFQNELKRYINIQQRSAKSYAIDIYLKPDQFPVKSGQKIGFLGNSGSSGGPHLHFELRDGNANPVNIISRGIYDVSDKFPPIVSKIFVYQCDTINNVPIFKLTQTIVFPKDKYGRYSKPNEVIRISKKAYIAYEIVDYKDAKTNTMGVSQIEQKIDGKVNFDFFIDKISYSTTRFINTFVQYDQNRSSNFSVIRAYVSPNNKLDIYKNVVDRGLITPPAKNDEKQLNSKIIDDAGNVNEMSFKIVNGEGFEAMQLSDNENLVLWNVDKNLTCGNLSLSISFGALYEDCIVPLGVSGYNYIVGNENIPLQNNVVVTIRENIPDNMQDKVCLAVVKSKGKLSYIGGKYKNGEIIAKTRTFGKMIVAYDSIAPVIKPRIAGGSSLKSSNIAFTITDDLSGIKDYDVYVDDKWVIGEFDPKTNTLKTNVILSQNPSSHQIKVVVKDSVGNIKTFKTNYLW